MGELNMQEKLLKQMIERMDILISLSIPPFNPGKYPVSGLGSDILKLCDGEHAIGDIVKKIGKKRSQIDVILTKLRKLSLLRSVIKDGKTYYIRMM